jgi:threonylcarbamoyladenosine tRNA methylthiotransferase MtaB
MAKLRVSFLTLGCRVNQYETDMMSALLADHCALVDDEADIYILNGCSVTGLAEKKARQAIHRIRAASPRAVILLTGCLGDTVARGMAPFEPVDVIAGNAWKTRLPEVIARILAGERGLFAPALPRPLDEEASSGPNGRVRASLKVEDGCSGVCAYCHAVQLRGEPRSKSLRAAVAEAERLVGAGFPEIVLTGVNLAEYSTPEGGLSTLVRSLLRIQDLVRLRLASLNVAGITDGLLDAFADDARLCPHFHIPLQTGSDDILRAMRRPYTVAVYRDAVTRIRRRLPDATFGSDLIVGFPGENEAAFAATCRMVEEVGFSNLHTFRFSPRPGTEAAGLRPPVPESVKRDRADRLAAVWAPVRHRLLDARLGKVEDVLTEAEHEGRFQGHSAGYYRVTFASDAQVPEATLCCVRITGASDDGLEGVHDDQHRAS